MKGKFAKKDLKELIILGVVALICLLYIGFRKRGELNYTLPTFPIVATDEFTALEILSPEGETIRIEREGTRWLLSDEYPADPSVVNRILDSLETINPVDLVSESEKYGRYELDEEHRYVLKGYKKENLIREIYLGKLSSSENYNYVLFPRNKNVYTLRGALIKTVNKEPKSLRDKVILQVNRNNVSLITYSTPEENIRLTKGNDNAWKDQDESPWDTQKVQELLGQFTSLKAVDFPQAPPPRGKEIAMITLRGDKESTLTLFEKGDDGYPARSSDYPFPVIISEYTGNTILEDFTKE